MSEFQNHTYVILIHTTVFQKFHDFNIIGCATEFLTGVSNWIKDMFLLAQVLNVRMFGQVFSIRMISVFGRRN